MASLAAALLLMGCAGQAPSRSTSPPPDLGELRTQFGLPECPATDASAAGIDNGLPQTDLPCLGTSQRVNLAGLPRKATIVNVWAQWCQPCREESPFLREAITKLPDVSFVGINYNDPQPDWAIEFAGRVQWRYPHVQDQDKQLQASLGVPGVPTTYFVAADGTITHTHAGPFTSTDHLVGLAHQYLGQR